MPILLRGLVDKRFVTNGYYSAVATSTPTAQDTVFCDDEDIAIKAGGDFILLVPRWQRLAYGTDGAFAAQSWRMTSASATFTGDVGNGNVIWLTKPAYFSNGGGEIMAVSSVVNDTTIVVRRLGLTDGRGVPPGGTSAQTGVEYAVPTLIPQIYEATRELERRLGIDANTVGRTVDDVRDLHDLQLATVLTVLIDRISTSLQSDAQSIWNNKLRNYSAELDDVLARLRVRWGPVGSIEPEESPFTMRFGR